MASARRSAAPSSRRTCAALVAPKPAAFCKASWALASEARSSATWASAAARAAAALSVNRAASASARMRTGSLPGSGGARPSASKQRAASVAPRARRCTFAPRYAATATR